MLEISPLNKRSPFANRETNRMQEMVDVCLIVLDISMVETLKSGWPAE